MSWTPRKRFWTHVTTTEENGVLLDGKPLTTPARRPLTVPSRALAEAIAAEWRAVASEFDARDFPLTRAANTALDRVTESPGPVIETIAAYGDSDLLCYRAAAPEILRKREAEAWDPWLDWSATTLGARLVPVTGVMHQPQSLASLATLRAVVAAHDPFELTALHDLVSLSGSLVLGLAISHKALSAPEAWPLSRIDEVWEEEQWGIDDEAAAATALRAEAFLDAERLLSLTRLRESLF